MENHQGRAVLYFHAFRFACLLFFLLAAEFETNKTRTNSIRRSCIILQMLLYNDIKIYKTLWRNERKEDRNMLKKNYELLY